MIRIDRRLLGVGSAVVFAALTWAGCKGASPAEPDAGHEVDAGNGGDAGVLLTCGNAALDSLESCDDGNTAAGDGCSQNCAIETGYACSGTPSVCSALPPECAGTPSADNTTDNCAVFVQPDATATSPDGTKANPFKSLQTAVLEANGKKVFVCKSATIQESVRLSEPVAIFGGFDCAQQWAWDSAEKSLWLAPADQIALTIESSASGSTLWGFEVRAANASLEGGSSIAAVVDHANAGFTNVAFVAGNAVAGKQGANWGTNGVVGIKGLDGATACSDNVVQGGMPVTFSCGDVDTIGANGGLGYAVSGAPGGDGLPYLGPNSGVGANQSNGGCEMGGYGSTGVAGIPGAGAAGLGAISATGYTGVSGGDGKRGGPGQGGGGGGGSMGGTGTGKCPVSTSAGGASGASGGSGGCGGEGGRAGLPGGSSIALISLSSNLAFENVTMTTGSGGNGGAGSQGQNGGAGGTGGTGGKVPSGATLLLPACNGGGGGIGGRGGPGGGGLGGHSVGIAYLGNAPPASGWTATPGTAGAGGGTTTGGETGAGGVSAASQSFE